MNIGIGKNKIDKAQTFIYQLFKMTGPQKENLKLEINKRLNLRTFHLNNHINQDDHHQGLSYKGHANDTPACSVLPTVRGKMK